MNSEVHTEKQNFIIVDQIHQLINETIKKCKLGKLEFYGGCFARDIEFNDIKIGNEKSEGLLSAVDDNQLYRWVKKKNILSFSNKYRFVISAQTEWLRRLIAEKSDCIDELEMEIIKQKLLELLPEVLQKKIILDNYSLEQLISINLIHDYCNTLKKQNTYPDVGSFCESYNELEQLKKLLANKNSVLISGMPLTGKTELALSYMKKEDFLYTYYDYTEYRSPETIEQVISVEEEALLAEVSELFSMGQELSLNDYLKIMNPYQKQAIVVDNFNGSAKELEQLFKIVEGTPVCMFVITQKEFPNVVEQMHIERISKQAAIEHFFTINDNKNDREEKVINEIAEKVFEQAWILLLIAQWYRKYREKYSDDELMALEQLNHAMDDILTAKLSKDIEFRYHSRSKELNLLGHIRGITENYLTTVEPNTYMLLACLAGVSVPEKYLIKWLNINSEQLAEMNRIGWCEIGTNTERSEVKITIPKLIAVTRNITKERKSNASCEVLNRFLEAFSKEIRNEECGEISDADIRLIITHLHRYCVNSMEYKKGAKQRRIIIRFHLDCIRYYLMMCNYDAANKLYETWEKQLSIDDDSITIRVLKAYMGIVGGDIQALKSLEDDYIKPMVERKKQFEKEIYHELQEILIIILRVFWSNYERWILAFRTANIDKPRIYWNIIENYTTALKITSQKWEGTYMNPMKHYWAIFQMENRVNGFFANDYKAFHDLKALFESTMQKKKPHSRMRNINVLRFLLDFQFVLLRHISFVPIADKELFLEVYVSVKNEIHERFMESNKYLPDDVLVKATIIIEYAKHMGL